MTQRFNHNGFTLIEVMIALAVVAIGLMATLKAINEEVNAAAITRNKMLALWVLENKVSEIRLNSVLPNTGINQSQQTLFNQNWIVQTNASTSANAKIMKVEVSIFEATDKEKKHNLLKQNIYLGDLR